MKTRIREAILVEGRYDKNTLSQIVDTAIFQTDGFGILKDRQKITFLRQVAEKRGLIVFTDSDGAGFVIRNRLKSCLPKDKLLHAYIPDILGKERRKTKASREGLLGVEGMTPEIILACLRRCGAHFLDEENEMEIPGITRQDLYELGLIGCSESSLMREYMKKRFQLPSHLGTSGFLDALNLITTLDEIKQVLNEYTGTL